MFAHRSCIRDPLAGMGWRLSAEQVDPMLAGLGKVGAGPHNNYFLRPSDLARAIAFVAERHAGVSW